MRAHAEGQTRPAERIVATWQRSGLSCSSKNNPQTRSTTSSSSKRRRVWTVHVEWGRRGSNLQKGTKAVDATLEAAEKAFEKVVRQKTRKGYEEWTEDNVPAAVAPEKGKGSASKAGIVTRSKIGVAAQLLNNVASGKLDTMFKDRNFWAQQKFDGKRVIVHIQEEGVLMTKPPRTRDRTRKEGRGRTLGDRACGKHL